jgi:serine/threonine-protein kinase
VTSEWLDQLRKTGATFSGGQGRAYAAEAPDGTGVFVKMLNRQNDRRARARFAREAAAYETLEHPGLPAVISHNADRWRDSGTTLYLALELIEGPTLGQVVRQTRLDLTAAVGLTIELLQIIDFCHANDVVHRDLKPANIVMGEKGPVIVDFGLSFNAQDSDTSDLTRVNEEVGNRFLRLPEHSTGGRSPVGDLTQLAGILFFVLTGVEPRVLIDQDGLKPHQRAGVRDVLRSEDAARARRLLSVFDVCFDVRQDVRPQTARHLVELLEMVMQEDAALPNLDQLLARLDQVAAGPAHADATRNATTLTGFTGAARGIAERVATERGLDCSWGGGPNDYAAQPAYALLRLGYATRGMVASSFVAFRFELRGADDVVLVVDGSNEVWRGQRPEGPEFSQAILTRVIEHYLDA